MKPLPRDLTINSMGDAPDIPMWRAVTTDVVDVPLHGHTRK